MARRLMLLVTALVVTVIPSDSALSNRVTLPTVPVLFQTDTRGDFLIWKALPVHPATVFCMAHLSRRRENPISMRCVRRDRERKAHFDSYSFPVNWTEA